MIRILVFCRVLTRTPSMVRGNQRKARSFRYRTDGACVVDAQSPVQFSPSVSTSDSCSGSCICIELVFTPGQGRAIVFVVSLRFLRFLRFAAAHVQGYTSSVISSVRTLITETSGNSLHFVPFAGETDLRPAATPKRGARISAATPTHAMGHTVQLHYIKDEMRPVEKPFSLELFPNARLFT